MKGKLHHRDPILDVKHLIITADGGEKIAVLVRTTSDGSSSRKTGDREHGTESAFGHKCTENAERPDNSNQSFETNQQNRGFKVRFLVVA